MQHHAEVPVKTPLTALEATTRSWLAIGQESTQFAARMARLTLASVEGNGKRLHRLGTEGTPDDHSLPADQLGDVAWRLARCHETWVEEVRNIVQIARITQDELFVWSDRLWRRWLELLVPAEHSPQEH